MCRWCVVAVRYDARMKIETLLERPPWEWPEGTRDVLLEALRNRDQDGTDRRYAAELAGDLVVIDDDLADALLAVAGNRDEPVELRARAAISLGPVLEEATFEGWGEGSLSSPEPFGLDDVPISARMFDRIQDTLRLVYMDAGAPKEVRRMALEASSRAPRPWHRVAVRGSFHSGDPEWKLSAVFCMGQLGGFETEVIEALEDTEPLVQYQAVRAAGEWELAGAWPRVSALLSTPETDRRLLLAAVGAAASIRPDDAREILIRLLDRDDEEISEAIYDALNTAGAPLHGLEDEYDSDAVHGELDQEVLTKREYDSIDAIMTDLWTYDGVYKRDAIEAAIRHQAEITPRLIQLLEQIAETPGTYADDDNFEGAVYAVVLLRHFRESAAHPALMRLARLPDDTLEALFGDLITEDFGSIFYATCGGTLDSIRELVLDRKADPYIRAAAMEAMTLAVAGGVASREETIEFFEGLFSGDEAEADSGFWSFAAVSLEKLYPKHSMAVVEDAYRRHLIEEFHIGLEDFRRVLSAGKDAALARLRQELDRAIPDDIHADLSKWACFRGEGENDDEFEALLRRLDDVKTREERRASRQRSAAAAKEKKRRRKQEKKARKKGKRKKKKR